MKIILSKNFFISLLFIFFSGCASAPDIVSTEKSEGEKYSADEIRQMTVDQPFLLSGDYFRERNLPQNIKADKTPSEKNLSKNETHPNNSLQSEPPKIKSQKTPSVPSIKTAFPLKIALIFDSSAIEPDILEKITSAATKAAKNFPVIFITQDEIIEALNHTDCLIKKNLLCVSENLSIYPGARMLGLIERFNFPENINENIAENIAENIEGTAKAYISLVDTGLMSRYPTMEISRQIKNETEAQIFIEDTVNGLFKFALKKREIMPWFCRTFSKENKSWYISAGKLSGLKPGDRLAIISEGQLIKSPSGLPAGWMPGKEKGLLKVEMLFGNDLAACSLLEGNEPKSQDILIFKKR